MHKFLNIRKYRCYGRDYIMHLVPKFDFTRRDFKNIKNIKLTQKIDCQPEELENKPENFKNDETWFLSNNIYLQIASCLNKLGELDSVNEENKMNKLKEILSDKKIKINDEEIMQIINLSNSKKYLNKEIDDNELEKDEKYSEMMDYVQKIINEELSEEEFTENNKMNIRFKRPPHTLNELKSVFEEADEIYAKNRSLLMENDTKSMNEMKDNFSLKIPNYLVLRSLSFPATNSEITVVGVQRNSNLHALYLSNLLESIKPDLISVHLSPDNPLFIKAEGNFRNDWRSFVAAKENFHFLVNPLPSCVNDIVISSKKLEQIFDENFACSKEISVSPKIIFSNQSI